jgi:hypothetical protein
MIDQQLIFDIGAHSGEDTEFYLKKGFSVVAVDASIDYRKAVAGWLHAYVETGQLRVLNLCIAEASGTVDFYSNDTNSIWSTANPSWVGRNERTHGGQSIRTVQV